MNGPKIVTLDIETAPNLVDVWGFWDQNVSINQVHESTRVIAFAAKTFGESTVEFRSNHHDGHRQMIERAHQILDDADVVVHYNGTSFDMPHLRKEFLLEGFDPPSPVLEIDLLRVVKSRFKFPSNKLDFIAQQLGLGSKLKHEGHGLWIACVYDDDPAAWGRMRRYNIQDVKLTEALYVRLRAWIKPAVNLGVFFDDDGKAHCPRCTGTDLQKRGFHRKGLSVKQRFQCQGCGGWTTDAKSIRIVAQRGVE